MEPIAEAFPPHRTLIELIEAQADQTPASVAIRYQSQSLTYSELARRSHALAGRLTSLGVGPGALVTVFAERSIELVVGLLATLKAGGAYVPVDPGYPRDRIEYMMRDASSSVVLTQSRLADTIPGGVGSLVVMDEDDDDGASATSGVGSIPKPEDLAYVIYTSGSTGRPKGVMNTHAGICNRLLWMQKQFGLTMSDRILQKTPYSFDVSVWEFFWPLMTGAELVVAEPGGHLDPSYLAECIEAEGVTVIHFVPSMLQVFLETDRLAERCKSLRLVICSGEALTPGLTKRFFERLGPTGAELYNLYGPTEAAVDVTYWRCTPEAGEGPIPIGHPVSNTQIHVLNQDLSPVPVGQEGELFIGGVQVARGYLNRPDLTAERFLPDPFSEQPGAMLYRTGDLARERDDGAIEYLGRTDDQVKIRGFRIELGEIQTTLEAHSDVAQAVVIAKEDAGGGKRLMAYVAGKSGRPSPTPAELRRFAAARLPEYMVPATAIVLDELPLTPNGKVDRAALPYSEGKRPDLEQPFVAPRNGFQRFVADEWTRILSLDRVGIRDRFFELGGDSLQAASFVQRMRAELGEHIYVTTIFEAPSVEEYTRLLSREYPEAVANRFGEAASTIVSGAASVRRRDERVDEEMLKALCSATPTVPLDLTSEDAPGKNSRAMFILSPPRSGTTLLRVMLAGHPGLFAAAELQLLGFHSLQQRAEAYTGKFSLWLEGTIRALMELLGCDAEEAKAKMAEFAQAGFSTKRFYREIQRLAGDRMLVDKSPSYAMDAGALQKGERDFEGPLYVHLVRHPYAVTRSFERYHMDQVLYLENHAFTGRELGELVWLHSHRTTLDFLAAVPANRQHRLSYEELVVRPRQVMETMCRHFGLAFHEGLVEPYKNLDKKMTDGLYATSTPMGDTKLLERTTIDPSAAETWRAVLEDDFLADMTWDLAQRLGYDRTTDPEAGSPTRSDRRKAAASRRQHRRGGSAGGS